MPVQRYQDHSTLVPSRRELVDEGDSKPDVLTRHHVVDDVALHDFVVGDNHNKVVRIADPRRAQADFDHVAPSFGLAGRVPQFDSVAHLKG